MLISKFSPISENHRDIPVTGTTRRSGVLIQNAMPNISADDKNFHDRDNPEEWDCHFSDDG